MNQGKSMFWKPGTASPSVQARAALDRDAAREGGEMAVYNPMQTMSIMQQRSSLPSHAVRREFLYVVETKRVTIVVGETGSGKTTQLPQYLLEGGWAEGGRLIGCTQPRRVAAASVAARVCEEMNVDLGDIVGYRIRFDDRSSPATKLLYMTDGMLVRELMIDPLLTRYSVIMFDEAHERSIYTDLLLGLIKKIMKKRDDLRIIVSSATLDAQLFYQFFNENDTDDADKDTVAVLPISGRAYPVELHHLMEPCVDYRRTMVETIMEIHQYEGSGDILCFLTGQDEIESTQKLLNEEIARNPAASKRSGLMVLPLYAGLPINMQMKVFHPSPNRMRKCVLATNVAETSITVPGIVFVVDCGFVKIRAYDPDSGMESLVVVEESQSSAKQRAGRAGRLRNGKAYRLFSEEAFKQLRKSDVPEMQRCDLAPVVMQLKALGIDDVVHFDYIAPPPVKNLMRALELLYALGMLKDDARLSPFGSKLVEFPVEPRMARMLSCAGELGCTEEALTIAAMLSVPMPLQSGKESGRMREATKTRQKKFGTQEGDHLTMLNAFNMFVKANKDKRWCGQYFVNYRSMKRAVAVRAQLKAYCKRFGIPLLSAHGDGVAVRKAIVGGYFANAAILAGDGSYRSIRGNHELQIHPASIIFAFPPKCVIFHEVVRTSRDYMRDVTAIEDDWLVEAAPGYYEKRRRR